MKECRFVIVSSQGASIDLSEGAAKVPTGLFQKMWYHDEQFQDLQRLLADGWRPVRETAMGGGSAAGGAVIAFALVLLEREEPPMALPAGPARAEGITPEA
jgi:hypothetical protein